MTFLTLNKQDSSSRTNSFTFKVNKISSNIFTRIQNICNVTLIFVSLVSYLDVKALTLELKLPEAKKKKKCFKFTFLVLSASYTRNCNYLKLNVVTFILVKVCMIL